MRLPCRRTTRDPLVQALLSKYNINLLSVPRMNADVYDVYLGDGDKLSSPSRLSEMLRFGSKLPKVIRDEDFRLPEEQFSSTVSVSVVGEIFGGILKAFGVTDSPAAFSERLSAAGKSNFRLKFVNVTRDYVSPAGLHSVLATAHASREATDFIGKATLYITIGVVRAKGVEIMIVDETSRDAILSAGVEVAGKELAKLGGRASASRTEQGRLGFKTVEPIAFGIELAIGHLKEGRLLLTRESPGRARALRVKSDSEISSVYVGKADGSAFISISG